MLFLKNGTIAGKPLKVLDEATTIAERSAVIGLDCNMYEVYFIGVSRFERGAVKAEFPAASAEFQFSDNEFLQLLGLPLTGRAIPLVFEEGTITVRRFVRRLPLFGAQYPLILLRICGENQKLPCVSRTSRDWTQPALLREVDRSLRDAAAAIAIVQMSQKVWARASLFAE